MRPAVGSVELVRRRETSSRFKLGFLHRSGVAGSGAGDQSGDLPHESRKVVLGDGQQLTGSRTTDLVNVEQCHGQREKGLVLPAIDPF